VVTTVFNSERWNKAMRRPEGAWVTKLAAAVAEAAASATASRLMARRLADRVVANQSAGDANPTLAANQASGAAEPSHLAGAGAGCAAENSTSLPVPVPEDAAVKDAAVPAAHFTVLSATLLPDVAAWSSVEAGIRTGRPRLMHRDASSYLRVDQFENGAGAGSVAFAATVDNMGGNALAVDGGDSLMAESVVVSSIVGSMVEVVPMANPGRAQECPGVLTFIIERYDSLPDLMVTCSLGTFPASVPCWFGGNSLTNPHSFPALHFFSLTSYILHLLLSA